MLKRLYAWVLRWSETGYGGWALFLVAVAESSFFPIPPDALLIVLAIAAPRKGFRYALICTAGSVLGGMIGYLIGWQFMAHVGMPIVRLYGLEGRYTQIQTLYRTYDAWAVGIAGFTPIPYKVFTLAAGAFGIYFPIFVMASAVSRAARFFLVGGIIFVFGPKIKPWIERYFNWLVVVFALMLIGGLLLFRYLL
jgi:membrane protein YqaA with SNARE-associated domain